MSVTLHRKPWLADWRDENGIRHRKCFSRFEDAEKFERTQVAKIRDIKRKRSETYFVDGPNLYVVSKDIVRRLIHVVLDAHGVVSTD